MAKHLAQRVVVRLEKTKKEKVAKRSKRARERRESICLIKNLA